MIAGHDAPLLAVAALVLEAAVGYPDRVFRAVGHPVTWIGALIAALDRGLNRPVWSFSRRRAAGILALVILLAVVALVALAITSLLSSGWAGWIVLVVFCASLPAQRSLHDHVLQVAEALDREGVDGGRRAVSLIVGRDPAALDAAAIGRAAIESLAENFSDGVVAPIVWTALGGLPGGALYKAINTADSMIGHESPRYHAFGWAAARLDDLVNLPASRLSALWIVLAALLLGRDARAAVRAVFRDARHHRSPNAGWPEAAMAGALGLSIGGPRTYGGEMADVAFMGQGRSAVRVADIRAALTLYRVACAIQGAALLAVAAVAV